MGVVTTGDEMRSEMKTNFVRLYNSLKELIFDEYWGSDDWSPEFRKEMKELFFCLDDYREKWNF